MNRIFILALCCYITSYSQGQATNFSRVDSLFATVGKGKPGYIVGIIKDGELVYKKGFGLAELEQGIPLTPSSLFYIGSTSKHFTAACILHLIASGKLHMEDDIRGWLPELPDYGKKITVGNLLHHTSGLREYTSLMLVSGFNRRFEDFFDNAYVYQLLCRQRALNFPTGTAHQYSNGGYILLASIVERITKMSLRRFADSVLFKPLGMTHTFFSDDHDEVIPGRAQSYRPAGPGYAGFVKNFETYGDGGIFTTLEDLAKWDAAFYKGIPGIPEFSSKMEQTTQLDNGHAINYALGLNVSRYRGLKTIEHGGFMMAYDSEVLRFPDEHFSVIVLSNSYNTPSSMLAYQIADIYLDGSFKEKAIPEKTDLQLDKKSLYQPTNLSAYTGHFWSINENYYFLLKQSHDSLFYDNTNGYTEWLMPLGNDSFRFIKSNITTVFTRTGLQLLEPASNSPMRVFRRFDPAPPTLREVSKFAGTYYSEELQTTYTFRLHDGKLLLAINHTPELQLYPTHDNIVWNSKDMVWNGFAEIMFHLNGAGVVTGFTTGDSRLRGVDFKKTR